MSHEKTPVSPQGLMPVDAALALVTRDVQILPTETIAIAAAAGRVLAAPLRRAAASRRRTCRPWTLCLRLSA